MVATVPDVEPTSVRAGETWTWKRSLADYSATGWTLTYSLVNSAGKITLTATAATGGTHLISIPAVSVAGSTGVPAVVGTDSYTAGTYQVIGRVTDGTTVANVYSATLQVMPDLAAATSYDYRTTARQILDALNAYLLGRATANQLDVVNTAIADRNVGRDMRSLLQLREQLKAEVALEEAAASAANGLGNPRKYYARFARP